MVFGSALTEDKNYTREETCKIFLYRTLMTSLRNRGQIVTTTASSDIAATLLPGGQTTHSRFNLQLDTLLQHVFFFFFPYSYFWRFGFSYYFIIYFKLFNILITCNHVIGCE
jgi:hypothetical protein